MASVVLLEVGVPALTSRISLTGGTTIQPRSPNSSMIHLRTALEAVLILDLVEEHALQEE